MQLCKQSARNGKKQSRQDKSAGGRNGKTDLGKGNRDAIAAGQINALAMRSKTCFGGNKAAKAAKAAQAALMTTWQSCDCYLPPVNGPFLCLTFFSYAFAPLFCSLF